MSNDGSQRRVGVWVTLIVSTGCMTKSPNAVAKAPHKHRSNAFSVMSATFFDWAAAARTTASASSSLTSPSAVTAPAWASLRRRADAADDDEDDDAERRLDLSNRNALDTGVGRASTMASSSVAQSKWNKANVSLKLRIFEVIKVRLQLKRLQQLILATMNVKQVHGGRRKGRLGGKPCGRER